MNTTRNFAKVNITERATNRQKTCHPWIYDNEITSIVGDAQDGELVDVLSYKGKYIGTGFINSHSKIRVRIISRNTNDTFDEAFWERRLRYAWDYRKTVMGDDISCCRIIFGESDQFPGLTVDRFNDILVAQVLSLGIDKIKDMLFNLLFKILKEDGQNIIGIYERNDVNLRVLEGMEEYKGYYKLKDVEVPTKTVTQIIENGIKYNVDVENGQKTGFFLDQKYNRLAIHKIAKGKNVLDCFTHTGSFALNAAIAGAKHVHAVDVSETAIEMAMSNAIANNLEEIMSFEVADVFELLPEVENNKYDLIILDPPAFTKSRKTIDSAYKGYKEINYRAMKLLPRGGYLATASCSHFMENKKFVAMLHEAAQDAGVMLRQIEVRQQACDHPILWNVEETDYLKFYIFQVV